MTLGETKGHNLEYAEWEFARLDEKKEANDKFIKAFKKSSGQKTQTVIPSATTANNEWAVREGWSICDAMHWRSLCEKCKHAQDDIEGDSFLELMLGTIEISGRCESHPIGVIAYARTAFGAKTWDIDTLHMMMDNILEEEGPDLPDGVFEEEPPSPPRSAQSSSTAPPPTPRKDEQGWNKRRRMFAASHATQPDFDDDIEDK